MLRYVLSGLVLLLVLLALWYQGLLAPSYADYPARSPIDGFRAGNAAMIMAHRGHEFVAPENTREAFVAALDMGVEYLEIDMRLTSDGVPVVMHDASVDRTTNGEGKLEKLTLAEAQALDAGSWFASEFAGAQIPTVQEILELADGRACILADIKAVPNYRLIKMLREFSVGKDAVCTLVSIYPKHFSYDAFPMDQLEPERRRELEAIAAARKQKHTKQMQVFKRYWPAFPYIVRFRSSDNMDALLQEYPGAVAFDVNFVNINPELVSQSHERGLATLSRIPIRENEMESAQNTAAVIRKLDAAGVDILFVSDLDYVWKALGREPRAQAQ